MSDMLASPDRPSSLWWSEPMPQFPRFQEKLACDVAIIGGGITGITLAFTLIEQDARVALFDSGLLVGGASGRNAGFLIATPAETYAEQTELWGRGGARAMMEIGRRSHERIRELVQLLGISCDYRCNGSLRLARSPEEAQDLRASLPMLRADGFEMHEIDPSSVLPAHTAPLFTAAFLSPGDGEIHPVRFLHGLAQKAQERGAQVFEHSPVLGAVWKDGLWEVTLATGRVTAQNLVIASNAYAPLLCEQLEPLIRPRRGQMLATAPLLREIAPRPTYAHWGYQYWRQTPDQRLVIGGWRDLDLDGEAGFDDRPTEVIQRGIEQALATLVPEGTAIEFRWAGTMGFARDGRPLVGWLDPDHHLAICAGYTGHGMGMAAACTQDLARLLSWRSAPGISTFDPHRFPEIKEARTVDRLASPEGECPDPRPHGRFPR